MAWSEGAEAASDDGHGAELGPGLVHHVGAGGVLLAVLPIPPFQVVVCAGDGHLHGCASDEAAELETKRKQCRLDRRSGHRGWQKKPEVSKSVLLKSFDSVSRLLFFSVCVQVLQVLQLPTSKSCVSICMIFFL